MNNASLSLFSALLATGCIGNDAEPLERADPTPVLERSVGTWVEQVRPPRSVCDGCVFEQVHHIELDRLSYRDRISVRDRGIEICTLERTYRARELPGTAAGDAQVIDYKFVDDTCGWGEPRGLVFESFAVWRGSNERMEVGEYYNPDTGETTAPATWQRATETAAQPVSNGIRHIDVEATAQAKAEFCEILPDEGPCVDLCDPVLFASHIPDGVCVTFVCSLDDGRTILAGGCSP